MTTVATINALLRANANAGKAVQMERYMKNKFRFLGISTPDRRKLVNPAAIFEQFAAPALVQPTLHTFCRQLFELEHRELHHVALDVLLHAFKKHSAPASDAELDAIRTLLLDLTVPAASPVPHWDSVDTLAPAWGMFLQKCSAARRVRELDLLYDKNDMWLDRVAIIHQLAFKQKTDRAVLADSIHRALGRSRPASVAADSQLVASRKQRDEFFINKAIGWALRQLARVDANWVKQFVAANDLPKLSQREALKHIGGAKRKDDEDDEEEEEEDEDEEEEDEKKSKRRR